MIPVGAGDSGEAERTAFARLKGSVTSALVLISPDPTKPFHIEADSSDFAMGAVLSQISSDDEKWHPVAFLSKSVSPVERDYEDANNHPSPPRVAALYRGRRTSVRDLDGPQEPGVLHDGQATELEASLMVSLPLLLQLHTPSQTREVNG